LSLEDFDLSVGVLETGLDVIAGDGNLDLLFSLANLESLLDLNGDIVLEGDELPELVPELEADLVGDDNLDMVLGGGAGLDGDFLGDDGLGSTLGLDLLLAAAVCLEEEERVSECRGAVQEVGQIPACREGRGKD